MTKIYFTIIGLLFAAQIQAQLLNEIGFFAGGTKYIGDVGNEDYLIPNDIGGGLVYKRNMNSRISLRTTASYFRIKGNDANSSNIVRQKRDYSFSNRIIELAFGLEFSYFDYDITSYKHAYTPYLLVEVAGVDYSTATNHKISYTIPFGVGFKSKITNHIGFALEMRSHFTFEDDLDKTPLNFGNPNGNDWYFFTGASLVYSFGRPPCAVNRVY